MHCKFCHWFLFFLILSGCVDREPSGTKEKPEIVFENTTHDFGQVAHAGKANCSFRFVNKGNAPLLLVHVRATCGCTTPEWPGEPIEKGQDGKITVRYDTRRTGRFVKSIIVYSNASNSPVKLIISGRILPQETVDKS